MVILDGEAELPAQPSAEVVTPASVEKYAGGRESLGMTPEGTAAEYRQAIRFRPTKVLAW